MPNPTPVVVPLDEEDQISPNVVATNQLPPGVQPILTPAGPSGVPAGVPAGPSQLMFTPAGPPGVPDSSIEVSNLRRDRSNANRRIAILIKSARAAEKKQKEAEMALSELEKRVQDNRGPIAVQNFCCPNCKKLFSVSVSSSAEF